MMWSITEHTSGREETEKKNMKNAAGEYKKTEAEASR